MKLNRVVILAGIALVMVAFPYPVAAQESFCNPFQPGTCINGLEYNLWETVAINLWTVSQLLLVLSYQIESVRVTLLDVVFMTAYTGIVSQLSPLLIPVTIAAVMFGLLSVIVRPFVFLGQHNIFSSIMWLLLAGAFLPFGGQAIIQLEQARGVIGSVMFNSSVSAITPATFGVSPNRSDMAAPRPIYESNSCGISRPVSTIAPPPVDLNTLIAADDLAAALLYATADDIHCASQVRREGNPGLPEQWFDPSPNWATAGGTAGLSEAQSRRASIAIVQGANRALVAIIPSILAVLIALINLIFTLCLIVLGAMLPIALLGSIFPVLLTGVGTILRAGIEVLKVSWASSFILGFVVSSLTIAAQLGNAIAFVGWAWGATLLVAYLLMKSFGTLGDSITAINTSIAATTGGIKMSGPAELAAGAAAVGVSGVGALALGSVALAGAAAHAGLSATGAVVKTGAVAAAAGRASGSASYAFGNMLGQSQTIRNVAEIGRSLGLLSQSPLLAGIDNGYLSRGRGGSLRAARVGGERFAATRAAEASVTSASSQKGGTTSQKGGTTSQKGGTTSQKGGTTNAAKPSERDTSVDLDKVAVALQRLFVADARKIDSVVRQQRAREALDQIGVAKRNALNAAKAAPVGSAERAALRQIFRELVQAQRDVRQPSASAPMVIASGQPAHHLAAARKRLNQNEASGDAVAANLAAVRDLNDAILGWRASSPPSVSKTGKGKP